MLPILPISDVLPSLLATLATGRNAVLTAPPGAGKTSLVPLALLDAGWRGDGTVLMLEPRRLATRAAATRMASLLGDAVGRTVGYRTRLDSAVSPMTRIEVVTDGLLIRRLNSDPGLDGVAVVIVDEVHERSVESDLALALCRDLQRVLRPELRLLAMSATSEAARVASLLDAAVVESAGRMFPVTTVHAGRDIPSARELPVAMARTIRVALAEHEGDLLGFLPGMAEIRRTQALLEDCGALVLVLHGELPPAEQDLALRPGTQRRVVLATSIAETSLTVPGVRIVVDGGFRRAPRLDPATGLTRLSTLRISRATAEQRAGRAGREAPGVAMRLWSAALHRGLAAYDRAEILDAELSGLVLDCAAWGTPPAHLPFLDAPPPGAVAGATKLLVQLDALGADGRITETGRRMAALGAHPRLAAMMLAARTPGEAALAADLSALLEERDPMRSPDTPADISLRVRAIADGDPKADRAAISRIRRAAQQYRRRLRIPPATPAEGDPSRLIGAGFPDRIGQRRGEPGSFRLAGGGGARLSRNDPLSDAPLLAIAALEMKSAARIRLATPLDPDALPSGRIIDRVETSFDPRSGAILARRRRRLGALVLSDRTEPIDPTEVALALAQAVVAEDLRSLPWSDAARQFQARVGLMRQLEPDGGWPDLSHEALVASTAEWLAPFLDGMSRLADLKRLDLLAILQGRLPWSLARKLDLGLPTHLPLRGAKAAIDYTQPIPVAAARAQAFYGMETAPQLAEGRVPLRLALLSPAGRPAAITGDLGGFWREGWAAVRREMLGRYPKHPWPEDPSRIEH